MNIKELYEQYLLHPQITTDTRDCPPGSIFFALRGETFNGNRFAYQALDNGCALAVVDDPSVVDDDRLILVDDVLTTLQALAAFHRHQFTGPVIQITGTNGKTTTKELVSAVLSERYNVLFTQGNFNNHIGVPKTLLRLNASHQIAVIETGANHPGEIKLLSEIVDPDCGLITNVGKAHLAGFGSFEGVIRTKGELYDYLRTKSNAFVFINADNPYLQPIAHDLSRITYGRPGKDYDVEGEVLSCDPCLNLRFRVNGGAWQEVKTQLIGAYNIDNILAAVAVGVRFGVTPEQISRAIAAYCPTNNRSELLRTATNTLIVDAYNANPTSMAAALDNFRLIEHPHKMAILGGMRELGNASAQEHQAIIDKVATMTLDDVWLVGEEFRPFAERYRYFPSVEAVEQQLREHPLHDCLILIKGSNSQHLYRLPDYL